MLIRKRFGGLVVSLLLGLPVFAGTAAEATAGAKPVQRLQPPDRRDPVQKLDSAHFDLHYNPDRLSRSDAERARDLAESAWDHCRQQFGGEPHGKIELDLTPNFRGATGFARPGDPDARDANRRPMIGVRYGELDYLGLSGEYVLTHEVAHVFSGDLASGSLGEGIADWGAGTFSGIPMRQWWGRALKGAGLWIDTDAFFITGEFESTPEVNSLIRTAQYVESGLLVRYLVDRFGFSKFKQFAEEYSRARGRLDSNSDRRDLPAIRLRPGQPDPRAAPNPDRVMALFTRHFGESWTRLRSDWEQQMSGDATDAASLRRLVLAQSIYGAIRNYEMWSLDQPVGTRDQVVREAFSTANQRLRENDLDGCERALNRAKAVVEQLRKPKSVA
jgi:hypothetical protein